MTLAAGLTLRDATPGDLRAIARLRESAGWGTNEWALRAVIGRPFARCLVVEGEDGLAGVGSGVVYGRLGFVGNMIVAEAHRRRGIGSAVLEAITAFLEGAGCTRLELNATAEGRPLYERHGFASLGRSATTQVGREARLAPDPSVAARAVGPEALDALARYDRPRFGGDRRGLLELLLADPAATFLAAHRDGEIVGYACVRTDAPRVGPLLADEPPIAATVLATAFERLPGVDGLRLNLPPGNRPGAEWLRRLGLPIEPWDGRMARGPALPRREDTIYGMTVGALG